MLDGVAGQHGSACLACSGNARLSPTDARTRVSLPLRVYDTRYAATKDRICTVFVEIYFNLGVDGNCKFISSRTKYFDD